MSLNRRRCLISLSTSSIFCRFEFRPLWESKEMENDCLKNVHQAVCCEHVKNWMKIYVKFVIVAARRVWTFDTQNSVAHVIFHRELWQAPSPFLFDARNHMTGWRWYFHRILWAANRPVEVYDLLVVNVENIHVKRPHCFTAVIGTAISFINRPKDLNRMNKIWVSHR